MIDPIRAFLNSRHRDGWASGLPIAGGIVAGADKDPAAKTTLLLFDDSGTPAAVAKVARRPAGERALRSEAAVLTDLWAEGTPIVHGFVPRLIAIERIAGRLVLCTSMVGGSPMTRRYYRPGHISSPELVRRDFDLAGGWLEQFHRQTRRTAVFDPEMGSVLVDRVLARYVARFGQTADEEVLFADVLRAADDLFGMELPMVGVHGDYAIGNLLVDRDRVSGVVDWEFGSVGGPPFRDVYKFPTSYGFYLDRAAPGRRAVPGHPGREAMAARWSRFGDWPNLIGFAYSFFGRGWFPDLVRDYVLVGLDGLQIPHAANAVFFPVFLAEQAVALDDPEFQQGYRSLLAGFGHERRSSWLWRSEVPA